MKTITSNDMFIWLQDNIDPNVSCQKHKTNAGDYLGTKFFIRFPNSAQRDPLELIMFDDGVCCLKISGHIKSDAAQKILLILKEFVADK